MAVNEQALSSGRGLSVDTSQNLTAKRLRNSTEGHHSSHVTNQEEFAAEAVKPEHRKDTEAEET